MTRPTLAISSLYPVLSMLLAASACSSDDGGGHHHGDEHEHDAGAGKGPAQDAGNGEPAAPVYALVTQVFGAEGAEDLSYVLLADRFEGELELEDAVIEVNGRALGVGPDRGSALFLAGDGAPTVTRYDLEEDGTLREGDTLSFINEGLTAIGEYAGQFQFVSETRAYFFDGSTAQVLIWNPRTMTVEGAVPLPELVIEGATLTFGNTPLRHGNHVLAFAGIRKGPEVPSLAAVVMVDTRDDSVEVVTHDGCGYARDGVLGDDGMVYLATEAYGAAVHRLNPDNAAAPCLLRFDPEEKRFDEDFRIELAELAGGAAAGSLIAGSEGTAFLRVLDEERFEIAEDTHPRVLASAAAWTWARLELGDTPQLEPLDAEASGGSVLVTDLGEELVAPLFAGRDSTSFVPLTADGPGDAVLSVPGLAFSAVQLR